MSQWNREKSPIALLGGGSDTAQFYERMRWDQKTNLNWKRQYEPESCTIRLRVCLDDERVFWQ